MRSSRTSFAGLVAVLVLAASTAALAGPLDFSDVLGRACGPGRYKGRPYLMVMANRVNEPEAYRATITMSVKHLKQDLQPVVVFDLRTLNPLYRAFARTAMKRTGKRAIKDVTAKAAEAGQTVRPDIAEHTHLVPDDGGVIAQAVNVDKENTKPTFILYDKAGNEKARVVGEGNLGKLSALIESM
jgi:hypothetical protein